MIEKRVSHSRKLETVDLLEGATLSLFPMTSKDTTKEVPHRDLFSSKAPIFTIKQSLPSTDDHKHDDDDELDLSDLDELVNEFQCEGDLFDDLFSSILAEMPACADAAPPSTNGNNTTMKRSREDAFGAETRVASRVCLNANFDRVHVPLTASQAKQQSLRALYNTYWDGKNRLSVAQRSISANEFALAKSTGVMFDPAMITHRELMERIRNVKAQLGELGITKEQIANAFVISLSTRKLELRSALSSFAVLQHFPVDHSCAAKPVRGGSASEYQCSVCAFKGKQNEETNELESLVDLNELNFERYKFGGVKKLDPMYCLFDLEQFIKDHGSRIEIFAPTKEGVSILRDIIKQCRTKSASLTASRLHKTFKTVLRSNKAERDAVVETLGMLDILDVTSYGAQGFYSTFKAHTNRTKPARRFVDMAYPACWWKGSDGLNEEALDNYFGHCL